MFLQISLKTKVEKAEQIGLGKLKHPNISLSVWFEDWFSDFVVACALTCVCTLILYMFVRYRLPRTIFVFLLTPFS